MGKKEVGINILSWAQVIIAIRILLFCIPVLLTKCIEKNFYSSSSDDWFILVMTTTGLLYLVLGMAAILRLRVWFTANFIVTGTILISSFALFSHAQSGGFGVKAAYGLPALFSIFMIAMAVLLKDGFKFKDAKIS